MERNMDAILDRKTREWEAKVKSLDDERIEVTAEIERIKRLRAAIVTAEQLLPPAVASEMFEALTEVVEAMSFEIANDIMAETTDDELDDATDRIGELEHDLFCANETIGALQEQLASAA